MSTDTLRVALVHDEFVRRGGAEAVLEEMVRMFPRAHVYGLYAGARPFFTLDGRRYDIRTSFLQKLPLWMRQHPRRLLPLLPHAAEQFDLSVYDLVISSSSGFAKGVITRSLIPSICYCHAPTRYLWDSTHEVSAKAPLGGAYASRALLHYLRMADFAAAQRPDVFIANSQFTANRIAHYYRRESSVVYPPIRTDFFTPLLPAGSAGRSPTEHAFVLLGRLTPAKHFEQAVAVCTKLQLPLLVVGGGSEAGRLRKMAGPTVQFAGNISDHAVRDALRRARALLQPGIEDFGMAAAEALACGTPVIAYRSGGVTEIVTSSKYGILYPTARPEGLAEALRQFMLVEHAFEASVLQKQAMEFSTYRFRNNFQHYIDIALRGISAFG
ncbi:MAG: glycosyltransferase [Candidatus Andersenbacteria bacterium]|nr:glycosyltransferase [Candidatus Andersenbacteria bacterium]